MSEAVAKVGDIIESLVEHVEGHQARVVEVGPEVYGEAYPDAVRAVYLAYLPDEVFGIWMPGEYVIVEES